MKKMIKSSRRFFKQKKQKDKRYPLVNGFLTEKEKTMKKKGKIISSYHWDTNSQCLAWRASAYHTALLVHQLPEGESINLLSTYCRLECFAQSIPHF